MLDGTPQSRSRYFVSSSSGKYGIPRIWNSRSVTRVRSFLVSRLASRAVFSLATDSIGSCILDTANAKYAFLILTLKSKALFLLFLASQEHLVYKSTPKSTL
ncbi:uncharacterized protein LOC116841843 [Odontomachus brunneus]|uniref:uncharacterized protein LOC116841843 n=1 Tax=Odontomachus brunneus TaxID=486640 RepID=UPI0013F2743E|nr:uncharacterized protein LOC116841843 [Odontomachus brunneus]